jgi:hypothetical protein
MVSRKIRKDPSVSLFRLILSNVLTLIVQQHGLIITQYLNIYSIFVYHLFHKTYE